ncbi:MAG: hypothetical protein ABF908_05205 [Lentilactobacillus diolivorans]
MQKDDDSRNTESIQNDHEYQKMKISAELGVIIKKARKGNLHTLAEVKREIMNR